MGWSLEELREGKMLLVDKPLDWTSFDVVNKIRHSIRKTHNIKKIKVGHAGTLDPKATGLLLLCIGRATKDIPALMGMDKRYHATLHLGAGTPSFDTETEPDVHYPTDHITEQSIRDILPVFTGDIMQKPPVFSAIKKEGKRLYESARKGIDVEIESRPVTIHSIDVLRFERPILELDIHCAKGTYIRSLAHDLGRALDSGAYLAALRRTTIGNHSVDDALRVEEICALVDAAEQKMRE